MTPGAFLDQVRVKHSVYGHEMGKVVAGSVRNQPLAIPLSFGDAIGGPLAVDPKKRMKATAKKISAKPRKKKG